MNWSANYSNGNELRIRWADVADVVSRIAQYRDNRGAVPAHRQKEVEIYAEATYLKYRSARDDFSATANSYLVWARRKSRGQESLALLEAWTVEEDERLAGAILIRSAWNGDLVIDFVVSNQWVMRTMNPPLANVAALLIAAVLDVGVSTSAEMVWAETAEHSTEWWSAYLPSEYAFIRFDSVEVSRERLATLLTANHVALQKH